MRRWLPSCSPLLFSDATHRLHYPHRPGHLTNSKCVVASPVSRCTRCTPDLTKPDAPRSVLDNDCISLRLCPWPDLQLVCPRRPLTRRPCLCSRFLMPSTRFEAASPSFAVPVAGLLRPTFSTRLDVLRLFYSQTQKLRHVHWTSSSPASSWPSIAELQRMKALHKHHQLPRVLLFVRSWRVLSSPVRGMHHRQRHPLRQGKDPRISHLFETGCASECNNLNGNSISVDCRVAYDVWLLKGSGRPCGS
ncbi:hypothetical protein HDK64DRAFT_104468 [Phyllosticta capitalensis]